MSEVEALLAKVSVVLVRPKYPENVGSAARAVATMGIGGLSIVGDPLPDVAPALKTATHHAAGQIHDITYFDSVEAAVNGTSLVIGTTARRGRHRMVMTTAAELPASVLSVLRQGGTAAILFGPEDTGLSNGDLALCGLVATIPAASRFSSINLAQAVMIVCYELRQRGGQSVGQQVGRIYRPRGANREEVESLMAAAALACQALDAGSARPLAESRLRCLRQALSRVTLSAREVKTLKDACRQVADRLQPAEEE